MRGRGDEASPGATGHGALSSTKARTCPGITGAPGSTSKLCTLPAAVAETTISVFIASTTTTGSPVWMTAPTAVSSFQTLPATGLEIATQPRGTASGSALPGTV